MTIVYLGTVYPYAHRRIESGIRTLVSSTWETLFPLLWVYCLYQNSICCYLGPNLCIVPRAWVWDRHDGMNQWPQLYLFCMYASVDKGPPYPSMPAMWLSSSRITPKTECLGEIQEGERLCEKPSLTRVGSHGTTNSWEWAADPDQLLTVRSFSLPISSLSQRATPRDYCGLPIILSS